jgi:two-component system NarL family sensor kinase
LLEREPAATAALLDRLQDEVQNVIADIRRLVQLRPPKLDELGLVTALREHTDRLTESDLPDRYIWTGSL